MIIKIIKRPNIPAFRNVEEFDQIVGLIVQATSGSWLSPIDLMSKPSALEDSAKIYIRKENLLDVAAETLGEKPDLYNALRRILDRFCKDTCIVLHSSEVMILH